MGMDIKEKLAHLPNSPGVYLMKDDSGQVIYVDGGLTRQAIDEYAAVGKMQLEAGQRAEAARTIETIIDLGPDEVDEYRHLLARIRSGGS